MVYASRAGSHLGINDPRTLTLFAALNKGRPYAAQVKPQNFLLSAQVAPLGHPPGIDPLKPFHLIAPYNADPSQWLKLRYTDRYSGKAYRVTTGDALAPGVARVKTYADVVAEYRCHREFKSLAPGGQPCSQTTVGVLRRRPVEALRVIYVGKETNRLKEVQHGLIEDEDEVMNEYVDPSNDPFVRLVVPVLRTLRQSAIAAAADVDVRTLRRNLKGESLPQPENRAALTALATQEARARLAAAGLEVPRGDMAALRAYVGELGKRTRICPVCGGAVKVRATFCSALCRQRARRAGISPESPAR